MTSANPSYKPSEGKREEFRKYLEKNGVMDALTRVLVNLYEEVDKPEDALEYIRDKLAVIAGLETNKQLQTKLADAEERIKDLESQLEGGGKTEENEPATDGVDDSQPIDNVPLDEQPMKSEVDVPSEDAPNPEETPEIEQQ